MNILLLTLTILLCSGQASAHNTKISSFATAKRTLLQKVYYDHRQTIYCGATFSRDKNVQPPLGFHTLKHKKRAGRIEWEHVVPAENFGKSFSEWREGSAVCRDSKGRSFKGRRCAQKANRTYRYMQADMYNLYPAIGAVNAMRSNYNFTMLAGKGTSSFGSCQMIIAKRKAQPPEEARGRIARTYKYMEWAYPQYSMSRQQQKLSRAWDRQYPVSNWECTRAERIEKIQGNRNPFVAKACQKLYATSEALRK
ncbi:endonuclease [Desulfotalea psychrophila]|uniref:Related to extracellular deoxyribonuclease [Precursor] n=1 Tax=Desulfotalea psychrophila (strain LSv54 / DSM 12343) TaxID=177439 RepID=Q6ARK5_DESPS|nr:endonuclease [Desulfotalea psychrophila]CAG35020.1 related to extracellular deoxyribonuclease [Precursor] [Desulfotalea psychrophila LSv54]